MGEAYEYMQMMEEQDMQESLQRVGADIEAANAVAAELQRQLTQNVNEWQPGCPFELKDIVFHSDLKECKVVGLPTVGDVVFLVNSYLETGPTTSTNTGGPSMSDARRGSC